jgi:hypothetical protein
MISVVSFTSFSTSPMSQSNLTQQINPSRDHSLEMTDPAINTASIALNLNEGVNSSAMVNSVEYYEPNAIAFERQVPLESPVETRPWKSIIGSPAITQASGRRRKKSAAFHCPYPACGRDFSAKHNLDSECSNCVGVVDLMC